MNAFLVIANILNLVYNAPQVWQTYRTKSTADLNPWFIGLRIAGNTIWIAYSLYIKSFFLLLNNTVTVLASLVLAYYKLQNRHQPRLSPRAYSKDEARLEAGLVKIARALPKSADQLSVAGSHH